MRRFVYGLRATLLGAGSSWAVAGCALMPWVLAVFLFRYTTQWAFTRGYLAFDYAILYTGAILRNLPGPLESLFLFLPSMLILLIWGRYFHVEVSYRCRYTMPRYGGMDRWYGGQVAAMMGLSLCMTGIFWAALEVMLRGFSIPPGIGFYAAYLTEPIARVHLPAALFLRLVLVLLLQSNLHMMENQAVLAFAVPTAVLLLAVILDPVYLYVPMGATFLVRGVIRQTSLALLYAVNSIYIAAFVIWGVVLARKRAFILRAIATR